MLLKPDKFKYAMSLDLNMGYYHIGISEDSSSACDIILPWENYRQKCLPIGVSNSLEFFQEKMDKMFRGFEFIWEHINELLIIN